MFESMFSLLLCKETYVAAVVLISSAETYVVVFARFVNNSHEQTLTEYLLPGMIESQTGDTTASSDSSSGARDFVRRSGPWRFVHRAKRFIRQEYVGVQPQLGVQPHEVAPELRCTR